jgi:putative spermidine/putrescine transport system ATP-binding protein
MVPEARDWTRGQPVDLRPRAFAGYRDNAVIYRSTGAQ